MSQAIPQSPRVSTATSAPKVNKTRDYTGDVDRLDGRNQLPARTGERSPLRTNLGGICAFATRTRLAPQNSAADESNQARATPSRGRRENAGGSALLRLGRPMRA